MSPRRPPLVKTRRRKKKSLPLRRGKERRGRLPQRGQLRGPKRGRPLRRTTPLTPTRTRRSGRKGPSVRRSRKYSDTRVTHDILLFAQLSLTLKIIVQAAPGRTRHFVERLPGFVGDGLRPSRGLPPHGGRRRSGVPPNRAGGGGLGGAARQSSGPQK